MFWVVVAFIWAVWSVTWFGAIWILDRYNTYNRFGIALVWGVVQVLLTICIAWLTMFGIGLNVIFCVFLLKLLVYSYELDLLRSLGVTITSFVAPYYVGQWMFRALEREQSIATVLLYGFPIATLVVWRILARRNRPAGAEATDEREPAIPVARVRRMLSIKRRPAAPVAVPPVVVAAPAAPNAPPAPVEPRPGGEPTLLR